MGLFSNFRNRRNGEQQSQHAGAVGFANFGGNGNLLTQFGYDPDLTVTKLAARFRRDGIARACAEALPKAVWRGFAGFSINGEDVLPLPPALRMRSVLIDAGAFIGAMGRAFVLFTGEGELGPSRDVPEITVWGPDQMELLTSGRYRLTRKSKTPIEIDPSRVVEVWDGLSSEIEDCKLYSSWNALDNLAKVAGGGSEAYRVFSRLPMYFKLKNAGVGGQGTKAQDDQDAIAAFYRGATDYLVSYNSEEATPIGQAPMSFESDLMACMSQLSTIWEVPVVQLMGQQQSQWASEEERKSFNDKVSAIRSTDARESMIQPIGERLAVVMGWSQSAEFSGVWTQTDTRLPVKDAVELAARLREAGVTVEAIQRITGLEIEFDEAEGEPSE